MLLILSNGYFQHRVQNWAKTHCVVNSIKLLREVKRYEFDLWKLRLTWNCLHLCSYYERQMYLSSTAL